MTSTERLVRRAPVPVLQRTLRLYHGVRWVSFLTQPVCWLLGVWVDRRWFLISVVPALSWWIATNVVECLELELERRRHEGAGSCPDRCEG